MNFFKILLVVLAIIAVSSNLYADANARKLDSNTIAVQSLYFGWGDAEGQSKYTNFGLSFFKAPYYLTTGNNTGSYMSYLLELNWINSGETNFANVLGGGRIIQKPFENTGILLAIDFSLGLSAAWIPNSNPQFGAVGLLRAGVLYFPLGIHVESRQIIAQDHNFNMFLISVSLLFN